MTDTDDTFEGEDVTGVRLILTKTGDGLSKSLAIAPVFLRRHQKVDLIVRADTAKIRFDDSGGDEGGVDRIQILECLAIRVVEDANVTKLLDQHLRNLSRQKEIEGQRSLDDEVEGGED